MRFIRENLFYTILIGLTVVLGGGAVVYYFLSDVREKLQSRATLASRLRSLARERTYKVDATTVERQRERI